MQGKNRWMLFPARGIGVCFLLIAIGSTKIAAAQTTRGAVPAAATAAGQPARSGSAAAARIDVTYLPPDAVAVISLRPSQLMTSANAELLPIEVASAAGIKHLGFDPAGLEEVVAFTKQLGPEPPTEYGVMLKFVQPFRGGDISPAIREHTQPGQLAGRQYLQSKEEGLPSFFAPDSRTLLIAPDATLRQVMEKKEVGTVSPLMQRVRLARGRHDLYLALDAATIRSYLQLGLGMAQSQFPGTGDGEGPQISEAPELVSAVEFTFNLSNTGPTSLVLQTDDAPSAQKLDQIFSAALKAFQDSQAEKAKVFAASDDTIRKAYGAYLTRTSAYWAKALKPERTGQAVALFRFEGGSKAQQLLVASLAGAAVPALFPADPEDALAAGPAGLDLGQLIEQMMSGPGMNGPPGEQGMTFPMESTPPTGPETLESRDMRDTRETPDMRDTRDSRESPDPRDVPIGRDGRPIEVDPREESRGRDGSPSR